MITVADCLEPFDYARLPAGVKVIAGYCGQSYDHKWTPAMVTAVHATGRRWWAIYTPLAQTLTGFVGGLAATDMAANLNGLSYPKNYPVFLDVERGVWDRDPAGARACIIAWRTGMANRGWSHAYPYAPQGSEPNWLPEWGYAPSHGVPPGSIGVQYAGLVDGGRYDLSIFTDALWDAGTPTPTEDVSIVDAATKTYLDGKFAALHAEHFDLGHALYFDTVPGRPYPAALVHIKAAVDALAVAVSKIHPGGVAPTVDVAALATALRAQLGPDLVKALAAQLAK